MPLTVVAVFLCYYNPVEQKFPMGKHYEETGAHILLYVYFPIGYCLSLFFCSECLRADVYTMWYLEHAHLYFIVRS